MNQSTSLIVTLASPDIRNPEFAPFVVVAFLGTAFLLFAAVVSDVIALALRKPRIAHWIGAGGLLAGHENSPLHGKIYSALTSKARDEAS